MQILIKEGSRVRAKKKFKAPYNDNVIESGEEGTVYGVGPAFDKDIAIIHVGVNTDSGKEVSLPITIARQNWELL